MNLPQYKDDYKPSRRARYDPSLEPKTFHFSSPESPVPSSSPLSPTSRPAIPPVMSPTYRDPLRFIHNSPRVAKAAPLHHRHSEGLHRYMHEKSHETCAQDDLSSPTPAFNHDSLVNVAKGPTQPHEQQHRHQQPYQQHSSSPGATRLRSRSPPSPRTSATIGTRRSTTIYSGGPRVNSSNTSSNLSRGKSERLPSLFAQLKAKLEAPRRPIIPAISTYPLSPPNRPIGHHHHHPSANAEEASSPSMMPSRSPSLYQYQRMDNDGGSVRVDRDHGYPSMDDGPWPPLPNKPSQPSLFGIPCSAAGQRAYSNHNEDLERCFLRLQHEDSGRIEHHSIAFATHLSIRWEPIGAPTSISSGSLKSIAATSAPTAEVLRADFDRSDDIYNKSKVNDTRSYNDHNKRCASSAFPGHGSVMSPTPASCSPRPHSISPKQTQQLQQQQHRNSPLYIARLISLSNYIRHIISLSTGNTPFHSQPACQPQRKQEQKFQGCRPMLPYPSESVYNMNKGDGNSYGVSSRRMCHDSASLPSPLSAGSASGSGPGPIKSMSFTARKHRFTSEYYDHQTRRQMYHHSSPQQAQGDHVHRLPSPTSPTVNVRSPVPQQQHQSQQQRIQGSGATLSPASNVSIAPFSPLLKVPYPNLTLTLALMYVDRLKAKYPEEKGEAGCSQRLFLVAYIIAAKYRCSVELAVLLQENEDFAVELERRQQSGRDPAYQHEYTKAGRDQDDLVERVLKARSRAELIFSNHEWVRLLCLGSFFRPPPPPSSSTQHQQQQQQHQHQQQQQQQPQDQQRSFAAGALMKRSPSSQITTQPSSPASLASPKPEPLPCDTYRSGSLAHPAPHSHPYPVASSTAAPTPIRSSMASSPSLPSPAPSPLTPLAPSSSSPILRVEDLDRMETEFLTFLDFDLSARSHDLRTCWSLLVEKEV